MRFLILAKHTKYIRLEIEADSVLSARRTVTALIKTPHKWTVDQEVTKVQDIQPIGEEE